MFAFPLQYVRHTIIVIHSRRTGDSIENVLKKEVISGKVIKEGQKEKEARSKKQTQVLFADRWGFRLMKTRMQ